MMKLMNGIDSRGMATAKRLDIWHYIYSSFATLFAPLRLGVQFTSSSPFPPRLRSFFPLSLRLCSLGPLRFGLLLFALLALPVKAQTSVPDTVNYQGTLTNEHGGLVDGCYTLIFNIHNASTGNSVVWGPQTIQDVQVIDGVFNVALGPADEHQNTRLLLNAFNNEARYVELTVKLGPDENVIISPRQQILTVPFAAQAKNAVNAENATRATSAATADNGVPIGTIIDWWRPDATFATPAGFQICNGDPINTGPMKGKATPNLLNRFIRGVTSEASIGTTGGKDSQTVTITIPGHRHLWAETAGGNWWSGVDNGEWKRVTSWNDGMDSAGDGHYPLYRNDSFKFYTDKTGDFSSTPSVSTIPFYFGLLKLIRVE